MFSNKRVFSQKSTKQLLGKFKKTEIKQKVITRGTKIYFYLNEDENIYFKNGKLQLNLEECRGKFIALNAYVRK